MFSGISFIFLLLALIAEIVGTIGGFGSSMLFVPIANFYFDFHFVLGLTAIFHVFSNLSKIALFKKGFDKKLVLYLGIPSVIFVIIGGVLSNVLTISLLQIFLGIFLISMSLVFIIKKNLVIDSSNKNAIIGGGVSGLLAGLLGTGGAVRGLTMNAFKLDKNKFIATSAIIDLAVDSTRTIVYFQNGFITKEHLIYLPFLLIIGFTGTYIGKRILDYIPEKKFRLISLFLILAVGITTLLYAINLVF